MFSFLPSQRVGEGPVSRGFGSGKTGRYGSGAGACPSFTAGDDCSPDDEFVRTLDTITFGFHSSANPAGTQADAMTLTSTLPLGPGGEAILEWVLMPAGCESPGSGISADGQTLTCLLGDVPGGTTDLIKPGARVLGSARNQQLFSVSFEASASNATSVTSNDATARVSAAPRLDVRKDFGPRQIAADGPGGVPGFQILYALTVGIDGGKGSELVTEDLHLTDDVSAHAPNVQLFDLDGFPACTINGDGRVVPDTPYGRIGVAGAATPERSVADSGTITCSQPGGPGTPISISLVGGITSGDNRPTETQNGAAVPSDQHFVASAIISLWLPATDVTDAGGEIIVTNTYSDFDPNSISGQSNYGSGLEPLANNHKTHGLNLPRGAFRKMYFNDIEGARFEYVPTQTDRESGDGYDMEGQHFATAVVLWNQGVVPLTDITLCEKIDTNTQIVADRIGTPGIAHHIEAVGPAAGEIWTVEYGTGTYADDAAHRLGNCEDGDSPDGWHATTTAVPGGLAAITKVRLRGSFLPPADSGTFQSGIQVWTRLAAKESPVGTILPNHASFRVNEMSGGNWRHGNYDPVAHTDLVHGDRLIITGAITRTCKERTPDDSIDQVEPGEVVGFILYPTVTAAPELVSPPPAPDVRVVDTLPAGLTYAGNASIAPDSVVPNPDGTTTIEWRLGDRTPNVAIDPITFDTTVDFDVPDGGQLLNEVEISSPADPSPVDKRFDDRGLTVVGDATLRIFKTVESGLMEPNEQMTFTMRYLNVGGRDLPGTDMIDILPYNGDGRVPLSDFAGTYSVVSITGTHGEVIYYSSRAPGTIHVDPDDPSNQPVAAVRGWCTKAEFGSAGCPSGFDDITAFRVLGGVFPAGDPERAVEMILEASGNESGDIYTNRFSGRTPELVLPVFSNDVHVPVVSGGLGDYVWLDLDSNGQQNAGEPGIGDVLVELLNGSGVVIDSMTTGPNGYYFFDKLVHGDYVVKFHKPAGSVFTASHATGDTRDSDVDPSTGESHVVTLGIGEVNPTIDAGIIAVADLAIEKNDNIDPIAAGLDLTYSITVTNIGPSAAADVVVTDMLDVATTYVSDTAGCTHDGSGRLACELGTMAPGATRTFDVVVTVDASAPTAGSNGDSPCDGTKDVCNNVSVQGAFPDPDLSNNSADEPTDVVDAGTAPADLELVKVDRKDPVIAGAFQTYTLSVMNHGANAATNIVVTDVLDLRTKYITDTGQCVETAPGTLECGLPDLLPGEAAEFDISVHVAVDGPWTGSGGVGVCNGSEDLCNMAVVTAAEADPDASNNRFDEPSGVANLSAEEVELSVLKIERTPEPVLPGSDVTYTVIVTNPSDDPAEDVLVFEHIDPATTYVSDTGGCVPTLYGSLECEVGTIDAYSSFQFDVVVNVPTSAASAGTLQGPECTGAEDLCNMVYAVTCTPDLDDTDNVATQPTDVNQASVCGNGVVEAGEECDPPSTEICNNGINDDGDGLIDCIDPKCSITGFRSCTDQCVLAPACLPLLDDPAVVRVFDRQNQPNKKDFVKVHARIFPEAPLDPENMLFGFHLSNDQGMIYEGELFPGDLAGTHRNRNRWIFVDKSAKKKGQDGIRRGIKVVNIRRFSQAGRDSWRFRITAYGDLATATTPHMNTQVYWGNIPSLVGEEWIGGLRPGKGYKWMLFPRHLDQ